MEKDKQLKSKAIKIQGKDYVLVSSRIVYFNEHYPNGYITTALVSEPTDTTVIIKAIVVPDVGVNERHFTGYSQAVIGEGMVNKTSALENAETSAVGRALAMMGIGVIDSVASADEMNKSTWNNYPKQGAKSSGYSKSSSYTKSAGTGVASEKQMGLLQKLAEKNGFELASSYSSKEASDLISKYIGK